MKRKSYRQTSALEKSHFLNLAEKHQRFPTSFQKFVKSAKIFTMLLFGILGEKKW